MTVGVPRRRSQAGGDGVQPRRLAVPSPAAGGGPRQSPPIGRHEPWSRVASGL